MVFCRGCRKEIHETASHCPGCGAVQAAVLPPVEAGSLWFPIPSFILGLVVLVASFDESEWDRDAKVGMFILAVSAIALGIFGLVQKSRYKGMSIAGIVFGALGLLALLGA